MTSAWKASRKSWRRWTRPLGAHARTASPSIWVADPGRPDRGSSACSAGRWRSICAGASTSCPYITQAGRPCCGRRSGSASTISASSSASSSCCLMRIAHAGGDAAGALLPDRRRREPCHRLGRDRDRRRASSATQFVNRVVSVVAWSIAALSIVGLLDEVIAGLDRAGIMIGGLRVTRAARDQDRGAALGDAVGSQPR